MKRRDQSEAETSLGAASGRAFVEAVLGVQSLVSSRADPAIIYQAVVDGALRLLKGDGGSLRFLDLDDPTWMVAVAWHGAAGDGERWRHRAPISEGLSGRVISTGKSGTLEDYQAAHTGSQLAPVGTNAIIGEPIYEDERVIGSLVVSSTIKGRHWTLRERDLFSAYAEHVGVALAVARASHAVREALTDSLTGLANRRLLLDRMQHELVRADRGGEPVTVLFMDLDGFKLVNDSLGHSVGDHLLVAVAERLRGCIRDGDVCARVGGDEFAVLLGGQTGPAALAERIIAVLQHGFQFGENEVFVSVSVGIVSGREDAETLLRQADEAMYYAKRSDAGSYQEYEPSMHAALVSQLTIGTELRRAIERDEFELYFQPIVDLRSGKIVAMEGLVRWHHPTRGLLTALDFIPVAAQAGMIVEIGRWVLENGCLQLEAWRRETPIALSLNVSARELQEPGYAESVRAAIRGRFPTSALILEVTQREPLEGVSGVLEPLEALQKLGVRIALDEFGAGYSTLLNLKHLPVDLVKVAKPFLDDVGHRDGTKADLLAGIISLVRHLGLTTVAVGIERLDQLDLLTDLDCDLAQGYLLGRPLDASGAKRLLTADSVQAPPLCLESAAPPGCNPADGGSPVADAGRPADLLALVPPDETQHSNARVTRVRHRAAR